MAERERSTRSAAIPRAARAKPRTAPVVSTSTNGAAAKRKSSVSSSRNDQEAASPSTRSSSPFSPSLKVKGRPVSQRA